MTITCRPVDPEALAIHDPYVNGFQVSTLQGGLVRIAFAEALAAGAKGNYRAAGDDARARREEMALAILNVLGSDPADAVVSGGGLLIMQNQPCARTARLAGKASRISMNHLPRARRR